MQSLEWVRWCLADYDPPVIDAIVRQVELHCRKSLYAKPLIVVHQWHEGVACAGYLLMCPGALGVIGHVRYAVDESIANESMAAASIVRESVAHDSFVLDPSRAIVANVYRELCQLAFEQGAELVQKVVAFESAFFEPSDEVATHDRAMNQAGMSKLATLVQLERYLPAEVEDISRSFDSSKINIENESLEFVSHRDVDVNEWQRLIEATYEGTFDVPELNGVRTIESTLAGYRSVIEGEVRTWWLVRDSGSSIGCLLLTPFQNGACEITYLGVIPAYRGRGIARCMMQFAFKWMMASACSHMILAVDERNEPAIRLYESFGFQHGQRMNAWFFVPGATKQFV